MKHELMQQQYQNMLLEKEELSEQIKNSNLSEDNKTYLLKLSEKQGVLYNDTIKNVLKLISGIKVEVPDTTAFSIFEHLKI